VDKYEVYKEPATDKDGALASSAKPVKDMTKTEMGKLFHAANIFHSNPCMVSVVASGIMRVTMLLVRGWWTQLQLPCMPSRSSCWRCCASSRAQVMDQETGKTFFTGNAAQMYQFFVQATGLGALRPVQMTSLAAQRGSRFMLVWRRNAANVRS